MVPGFVSWVLGIVSWVLGIVCWVLGFVFWVLGFVFWVLGLLFWVSGLVCAKCSQSTAGTASLETLEFDSLFKLSASKAPPRVQMCKLKL